MVCKSKEQELKSHLLWPQGQKKFSRKRVPYLLGFYNCYCSYSTSWGTSNGMNGSCQCLCPLYPDDNTCFCSSRNRHCVYTHSPAMLPAFHQAVSCSSGLEKKLNCLFYLNHRHAEFIYLFSHFYTTFLPRRAGWCI